MFNMHYKRHKRKINAAEMDIGQQHGKEHLFAEVDAELVKIQFFIPGKCVIMLVALLAVVQGASINDCGGSTFINQSSGGSPQVTNCQQIVTNIGGGGTWTTAAGTQRTMVTFGTCALGVTVTSGLDANVGNQDIIDLINSSIQMFTYNGLVRSKGTMSCQNGLGGNESVDWGIYHT